MALKKRIEKDEDEYGEEAKEEAKPKPKPKVEGNTEGDRSGSNTTTGRSPTGGRQRTATEALPPGWEEDFSTFYKKPFYFHAQTTRTTWVRPVRPQTGRQLPGAERRVARHGRGVAPAGGAEERQRWRRQQ